MNEPSNPFNPALLTAVRYVLTAVGGIFVTKGALSADQLNTVIGAVLVVVPTIYGAYLSYRNSKTIKDAAPYTPDAIINSK